MNKSTYKKESEESRCCLEQINLNETVALVNAFAQKTSDRIHSTFVENCVSCHALPILGSVKVTVS